MTPTDVLERAWKGGFKTKSDFARLAASEVAMMASDGFITTRLACGLYGERWMITPEGLARYFLLIGYDGEED